MTTQELSNRLEKIGAELESLRGDILGLVKEFPKMKDSCELVATQIYWAKEYLDNGYDYVQGALEYEKKWGESMIK